MKILVTGATGKVGRAFINRVLRGNELHDATIRALCHNRTLPEEEGLEIIKGNIAVRDDVENALQGITHVVHLATCKETPDDVMDVTVKGLFWLLEGCRTSDSFEQFILIGGDAGMGHFFYPHPLPVTETQGHSAYPGCYALSKVLEEIMLEQYYIQYDFSGCCLRAPWIMEKDDFRYTLTFKQDVFGGPRWCDLVGPSEAEHYASCETVPIMLDPEGIPVKRNFVHLDDLLSAIIAALGKPGAAHQETFNICMDEPIDYREVGDYLASSRNLPSVDVPTEFHSTWLDNSKARFLLGWRPAVDLKQLIDRAWDYQRGEDEPRTIWYPG
ncbi:MAG: UDP-glucose 4-epimerase [Roseibacillus sp.]|nr:UDP-glucose 4-epimerase [Roseibacillus sp.]|tara:strand:+ start:230 stop:1213 length:984 start_codon:yes stop_codon:yes gene_type:complete